MSCFRSLKRSAHQVQLEQHQCQTQPDAICPYHSAHGRLTHDIHYNNKFMKHQILKQTQKTQDSKKKSSSVGKSK